MSYSHQKIEIHVHGTGAAPNFQMLGSGTGIKGRRIFSHNYIIRGMSVHLGVSSAATNMIVALRKASEPSTTTATGTAVSGATITVPSGLAKGSMITNKGLNAAFGAGDQAVIQVSTAATKAFNFRAFLYAEPDWETEANTSVTTVTG